MHFRILKMIAISGFLTECTKFDFRKRGRGRGETGNGGNEREEVGMPGKGRGREEGEEGEGRKKIKNTPPSILAYAPGKGCAPADEVGQN